MRPRTFSDQDEQVRELMIAGDIGTRYRLLLEFLALGCCATESFSKGEDLAGELGAVGCVVCDEEGGAVGVDVRGEVHGCRCMWEVLCRRSGRVSILWTCCSVLRIGGVGIWIGGA